MASDTLAAKAGFLAGEARLDADAFRENTVYNGDGDAIRLIANAERLEQYAETMDAQATRIEALEADNAKLLTARASPSAGATSGAWLGTRWVFSEETNAGSAIAAALGAELIRNEGAKLIIRENEGLKLQQGAVASVGSIAFEVTFELI